MGRLITEASHTAGPALNAAGASLSGCTADTYAKGMCEGLTCVALVCFYVLAGCVCVCGDVGREVIRLTHSQGKLIQGQGPYLLLTPYHTWGASRGL
jgi:hypothetical protein